MTKTNPYSNRKVKALVQTFFLKIGTDVINPFVYPGFSLHKELQLLKECGIPDAEVFKMATVNAVHFLKLENEYGAVKPGLNASLILLTANPLEDISNTQKIESVFVKGNRVGKK
jgi:imidazolonepropionase-like amidohydrolase